MGKELLQKIQLIPANQTVFPHHCVVCTRYKGTFIDFGLDLEDIGVVYLCPDCFKAVGLLAGLVPVEELEAAQAQAHEYKILSEELEQKVDTYESVLDGINFLRRGSLVAMPSEPTRVESISKNSKEFIAGGAIEIKGSTKPVDESGPGNLLDDDGIGKLIDGI